MGYRQKVQVYQAADTTPSFIQELDGYIELLSDIKGNETAFDTNSLKAYDTISQMVGDYYQTGKQRFTHTDRFGQTRTSYRSRTSSTRGLCDRYHKYSAHQKMQRLYELRNSTRRRHALYV